MAKPLICSEFRDYVLSASGSRVEIFDGGKRPSSKSRSSFSKMTSGNPISGTLRPEASFCFDSLIFLGRLLGRLLNRRAASV
jgi:hypothetical protein